MKVKFLWATVLFMAFAVSLVQAQCTTGCTITLSLANGSSTTQNISFSGPNQTYCIVVSGGGSATITGGSINFDNRPNATLCIGPGVTIGSGVNFNNLHNQTEINNHGVMQNSLTLNGGQNRVFNHGTISGQVTLNANNATINNMSGGVFSSSNFNHNNGNFVNNTGASFNLPTGYSNNGSFSGGGSFTVNGNFATNSGASTNIGGAATITGNVSSSTPIIFGSTVQINGNLTSNNGGPITVAGALSVNGNVQANNPITASSTVTIGGSFTVNNNGSSNFAGATTIGGATQINNPMTFGGPVALNGGLTTNSGGTTNFNGGATINGNWTNNATTNFIGTVSVSGSITNNSSGTIQSSSGSCKSLCAASITNSGTVRSTAGPNMNVCVSFSGGTQTNLSTNITPTANVTGLSATNTSGTVNGSFTHASPLPGGYLVLRKPNSDFVSADLPLSNATYTVGSVIGSATVVAILNNTTHTFSNVPGSCGNFFFAVVSASNNSGTCGTYRTISVTSVGPVNVTSPVSATISYSGSPWCTSAAVQNVTRTGTAGGTYSASPTGLTLNASSGQITPSTSTPGTYTVSYTLTSPGCADFTTTTSVTINALPTVNSTTAGSRCGTGTVNLSGTASPGSTLDWYSGATGGSPLAGGTGTLTFTTPSIGGTTNYFAQARNTTTGCVSAVRTSVTATVNALPTVTGTTAGSRCGTGTVNLSGTASAGSTLDWYDAASGGNLLASGVLSFTTPSISATTSFFAEARNTTTGCLSAGRTSVSATIHSFPVVAALTGPQVTCIGSSTQFSSTTGGGVWSSDNNGTATVSGGSVTGVSAGTTNINYTVTSGAGCQTTVSRTVTVYNGPQGNPSDWGNGQWNAYVYNSMDFITDYAGFYTTGTGLNYASTSDYVANSRPSSAATYQGCPVGNTQYSIRYKRTGFTWGRYQIDIPYNDDGMQIILNGNWVYNMAGFNPNPRTNVWTGTLGPDSELEIRFFNNNGPGEIQWNFTFIPTVTASQPGTISGNQVACAGQIPVTVLGNVAAGTQGTCTVNLNAAASSNVPYQWQESVDNTHWSDVSGANGITYTIPAPLTQTTYFRRLYRTYCDTVASNTVTVTIFNTAPGDPSQWGNGQWNAYVYNSTDFSSNYSGFYTTASPLSYNSTIDYANTARPSSVLNYQGCQVGNTNYSIRLKRTNFTEGVYRIGFNLNDDNVFVLIDGLQVYTAGYNPTNRPNVWTGTLKPGSEVEIRYLNNAGPGEIDFTFTLLSTPTASNPGVIAGSQSICSGQTPAIGLTNVTAASAGSCTPLLAQVYQWQSSTDNLNFTDIAGANALGYTIPGPLTQTTYFRRIYRTFCDTLPSNTLTVEVFGGPQGTPGVHGNGQWNAYVYTGTDYASGYSGWFTTSATLTQNTAGYYNLNQAPSNAPGYLGCQIASQPYSVRFQRTGIPFGLYSIGIARNDDQVQILIDGVVAYTAATNTSDRPNVWVGTIYPTTLVEIRYNNTGGPGDLSFYFNTATFTTAATPGSVSGNQGLCSGQVPAVTMTSVSAGVAGSCTQVASATNVQYQWQMSTDNTTFTNIAGAHAANYAHPSPLTTTTYFRRAYRTYCDTVFSNVLTATVSGAPQGTPGVGGNGLWHAYVYSGTDYATGYSGYFTTSGALNQNTTSYFAAAQSPSNAPTYLGCQVPASPYSVRFQRTNIPFGLYSIGIARNDDQVQILIDGVVAFTRTTNGADLPNAWVGTIYPTTLVEIRYNNTGGPGDLSFYFNPATFTTAATPGSISGNQALCAGQTPNITLASVSPGVAGTCTQVASSLNVVYQWQSSTDNLTFTNIPGANAASYSVGFPLTQTTYFRRLYRTYCDTVISNVVTATVTGSAVGTPGVFGNGVWNAYVYDENNFTSYSGVYTTGTSLDYNTTNDFGASAPASNAPGYQGCQVSVPSQSIRFQRTNFTPGIYRIGVGTNDDGMQIILNGTVVYSSGTNFGARANAWTGFLTTSSELEINLTNTGGGQFQINWTFTSLPNDPVTLPGTIGGTASICSGLTASLTSPAAATVGTCTPLVANAYQWQSSTDNLNFTNLVGANAVTYTTTALTQTTHFRRVYRTYCDTVISNVVTITVNPRPAMTSSNTVAMCHNTQVGHTLTASIPSSFSWIATANGNVAGESLSTQSTSLINDLLVLNNPANGTTVTYTATPTALGTGCAGTAQTISVTVNQAPTMTSASSLNRCNGLAVNLNFTSNIASSYSWVANDNGNVSGESLSAQTGNTLTDVLTSAANTNQVVSYQVTPVHIGNGCAGATQTVNVTVFPTATMTSPSSLTRCSGTTIGLSLSSNVAGATYSWVAANNPSTTGESLTTQISATLNNIIINVSGSAQDVVYTITPSTSGALVCAGTPQTFTATINPAPVMTSAASFQACNNSAVGFGLTANPASTFTWIATANGNVFGESNSSAQSGATLTDVLVLNNNLSPTTVNYTVTPTAQGTGCVGANQTLAVTVNSLPVMTSSATGTICSGATFTRTLTSNPAATYTWLATDNSNVSGESLTTQTGSPLSNTLTNLTQTAQNVQYSVIPINPNGSCAGSAQTLTVTVNPAPVLTNALSFERCNNVAIGVALTANPASTFSWIATSNPNVTGESLTNQSGATINNTLVLTNNLVPTTVTYTVTPTASGGTGCVGAPTQVLVNVNTLPAMTSAATGSVCTGETLNFGLSANVASSFSWIAANNLNVSGESLTTQSGATLNNTLVNGAGTPQNVVYTVTPSNNLGSCVGTPQNVTITVNPNVGTPSAPVGSTSFCQGSTIPFSTSAPHATGYSWSVTGSGNSISGSGSSVNAVFDGNFNGPATVSVQALGCGGPSAAASTLVTVNPGGQWVGTTSNWNSAGNWCGGVPTASTNVIIPTGAVHMPQINAASFVNDITLQAGTSLSINGANSLSINGQFTNGGTFSPSPGSTVSFDGNGAQLIPAVNYGNLNTSGTGTKTFASGSTTRISGVFTPAASSHEVSGSTIEFNGTSSQNIPSFTFHNLTTSGNNAKTMTGTVVVNNQLTLSNGTLQLSNQHLTLGGTITGAGTLSGTCTSALTIGGAGASGTLNFTAGSRVLGQLNLSKTAAGTVNLGSDLDICSQLNLTLGRVVLGAYNLTLLPNATTAGGGAQAYVQTLDQMSPTGAGFLIQEIPNGGGERVFPVGTIESYTPAYLDNIGFTRNFKVRVFNNVYEHGTHGIPVLNADFSVLKTWEIEPIGTGGTPDVSIKLQWNPGDEGQYFATNRLDEKIYMGKNIGVGNSLWSKLLTDEQQLTSAPFTLSTARVTTFSKFAIGSDEAPLPVTLGRLSVESKAQTQVLRWKTYMEREALGFEVYRSSNGVEFQQIGFVKARGYASDYQFVDATFGKDAYYKIRFVGQAQDDVLESNIVLVRSLVSGSYAYYPNPVERQCTIEHAQWAEGDEVELVVTDLKGAVMLQARPLASGGKIQVNLEDLAPGLYLIETLSGSQRSGKQKVVKL